MELNELVSRVHGHAAEANRAFAKGNEPQTVDSLGKIKRLLNDDSLIIEIYTTETETSDEKPAIVETPVEGESPTAADARHHG